MEYLGKLLRPGYTNSNLVGGHVFADAGKFLPHIGPNFGGFGSRALSRIRRTSCEVGTCMMGRTLRGKNMHMELLR